MSGVTSVRAPVGCWHQERHWSVQLTVDADVEPIASRIEAL